MEYNFKKPLLEAAVFEILDHLGLIKNVRCLKAAGYNRNRKLSPTTPFTREIQILTGSGGVRREKSHESLAPHSPDS